jgi:hypothetical protein
METLTSPPRLRSALSIALMARWSSRRRWATDPAINFTPLAEASVGSEQLVDGRHRGSLAEPHVDLLDVGACEDARASLFGDAHAA